MSLGTSITINTGRALMAALQPLTGNRAAGNIRLRTQPGVALTVPRNAYWTPVIDGQRQTSWLFKTMQGPNKDKSWPVDDSGNSLIAVMSNLGGMRHNVPAGTGFQPDIPIDALVLKGVDQPVADAEFVGATNPGEYCGVQDMVMFETFDGPALTTDLHRSPLSHFPGIMIAFQDFAPADGVAIAQNNQIAINAGTDKKFYKVTFSISVITTKGEGDMSRRQQGLIIADAVAQLLNDKHSGDVGECLSNPGGVQVRQMIREDGPQAIYQKFYIYTTLVSCMTLLQRLDFRTFTPWLRTVMSANKPQVPSLPNQGPLTLVSDNIIDMTPGVLDLSLDGTFARATTANLWAPENVEQGNGALLAFTTGTRRITNPSLGLEMEPAITNDLGASAEDLTLSGWVAAGGATVTPNTEDDPLGTLTADQLTFTADADSQLDFAGLTGEAGAPVIIQLFAKAAGAKFTTRLRIAAVDAGATEHVSDDIEITNVWDLYRFEVIPTSTGALTVRLKNASDAQARNVMIWGVNYSDAARWGAEYTSTVVKAKDALTFTPLPIAGQQDNLVTPQAVLTGVWALRYRTPDAVTPDMLGAATGSPTRTLVSVGNGATELVTLALTGTPATGGANLVLTTRGDGAVIDIASLEWVPGDELRFTIDATGTLTVEGTSNGDNDYDFPRYAEAALAADFLVIGDLSTGASSPTPGRYVALETDV